MDRSMFRVIGLVSVIAAAGGDYSASLQARQSWPPGLQKVADQSPVLAPADEMKTFVLAPGYHAELVASEPMIQDPVLIDWDADGRLWAIEMPGYMHDILASDEYDPTGRIVVLEDTDHDGVMDKRTVFAEGLVLPRALKVLDHGVLVGEPPNLWMYHDTNGDLKSDGRELVTDTYGRREASVEHNTNSLTWALDNALHTSESDMYVQWKAGKLEVHKTLSRGQWGNTQDDAGRIYRNSNESVLHVDLVPTEYYARNPNLIRTSGSYESLEGAANEVNSVFPIRPTPGVNRGYQAGILRADGSLARYTAVCSPTVYRGDRLPAELYGNVFVAEPAGNTVSRIVVSDSGKGLSAKRAYETGEFLASTDERFRPVYLSSAPDGTLYVVDLYRGIVQHRGYITEYLRDQIMSRQLEQPTRLGRIYRIVHDTTRRGDSPQLSRATTATLVQTLSHPNGWWRDTAQRLLVERADKAAIPLLNRLVNAPATTPRTKLHALWTLDGLDATTPAVVVKALDDPARDVRVSAVRLSERWLSAPPASVQAALVRRVTDADWWVRDQVAATIGLLPAAARDAAIVRLLDEHGDDPVTVDAALSGLRGSEVAVLEALMRTGPDTTPRRTAIAMLSATVIRSGQEAGINQVFQLAADAKYPAWETSAVLKGPEIALLGQPAPGSGNGRRGGGAGAAVASEGAGSRGGPGGAAAFPRAGAAGAAGAAGGRAAGARGAGGARAGGGGGGRGGGGPVLRLNRAPNALLTLAAGSTDLNVRATAILARVEWPGKPGAASPVAPLTSEEQKRFDAGEAVFKNLCQACHQADGRGQDKVGANLIGSDLALAPADVPVRILLNGKEGKIGLMPPLGSALSDEQIASALTFIRRQWGQTGAPVDPATVAQVRSATSSRTRPWTDDELYALLPPAAGQR